MLIDGPHFQATDEGELVFLVSDGDSSRRPTEHNILEPEEENSTLQQNYYLRIPLDHPDSHRWRTEIAKYLAPLVLGSTYSSLAHRPQKPPPIPSLTATTTTFPCDLNVTVIVLHPIMRLRLSAGQ